MQDLTSPERIVDISEHWHGPVSEHPSIRQLPPSTLPPILLCLLLRDLRVRKRRAIERVRLVYEIGNSLLQVHVVVQLHKGSLLPQHAILPPAYKLGPTGEVERYKARWVVRSFEQEYRMGTRRERLDLCGMLYLQDSKVPQRELEDELDRLGRPSASVLCRGHDG
ncbi:hypothetical protein FDECE_272 [Fusarium decemcellulare]|nr:hypothetical protein FDECE_272 [Fusarium decemcellulare]